MHFHGLFVGLLGTVLSPAKMANLIKMLEGLTFVGPKEPHIKRGRGCILAPPGECC